MDAWRSRCLIVYCGGMHRVQDDISDEDYVHDPSQLSCLPSSSYPHPLLQSVPCSASEASPPASAGDFPARGVRRLRESQHHCTVALLRRLIHCGWQR